MVGGLVWIVRRGSALLRKSREVGPLYATQLVLDRLIPTFVFSMNTLVVVAADLRSLKEYRTSDPELRWAGPEDIEKMAATGDPAASVRKQLEEGARLAVVERGGRIVAYFWCRAGAVDYYDWLRFQLSPTDAWNTYAWVAPELRGQGTHARIRDFAYAGYVRGGCTRSLSVIDALNRNSIRAAAKVRALPVGHIRFVRVLGLTLVRFDRSVRVGWWGLGRRLVLPMGELHSE